MSGDSDGTVDAGDRAARVAAGNRGEGPGADVADEALVAAFVAGDQRAFTTLVDRYHRRVYGICYRYFGDPDEAEEAAQEAFVALLRRAETFSGAARFSTWMYRVATNACHDLARRRARRPKTVPLDVPDAPAADVEDVDDVLARRELGVDLERALATLEPEHREAVVLHDVAGVGYAELAARFGVPVGTVKSRVHRGHARLAAVLEDLRRPGGAGGSRGVDRAAEREPRRDRDRGPDRGNPAASPTLQLSGAEPPAPEDDRLP